MAPQATHRPTAGSRSGSVQSGRGRHFGAAREADIRAKQSAAVRHCSLPNAAVAPEARVARGPFLTINCEVRDVPDEMIATPPAWRPPWTLPGDPELVEHPTRPQTSPGTLEPKPLPGLVRKALSKELWSPESPRKMSKVLNKLMPLSAAQERRPASCLRTSVLALLGIAKAKEAFMCSVTVAPESPSRDTKWMVDNATGATRPNITTDAEVVAFRHALTKSYGNLTRAFRAMRKAASADTHVGFGSAPADGSTAEAHHQSWEQVTYMVFEWFVVAHLHFGSRRCARRLFKSMDSESKGSIGLWELVQPPVTQKGLMSLIEFRRRLLERHTSLWQAFRELEEHLGKDLGVQKRHGNRAMRLGEFINATVFFGLDPEQATSFFNVMDTDGNGQLTLNEFLEALTQMPGHVLLHDLRQRLLGRFASINAAFQQVTGLSGLSDRLGCAEFEVALMRIGIDEVEATELFRVIDDDGSGDISLQELQDALRVAAPFTSLAGFWHRLADEWPEIATCALQHGQEARQRARLLLADLMSQDFLRLHGGKLPGDQARRKVHMTTVDLPGDQGAAMVEESPTTLIVLTAETFDALAVLLDISHDNAMKLFRCIVLAAGPQPIDEPGPVDTGMQIYVEDFLEQLKLWTEDSLVERVAGMEAGDALSGIRKVIAPTRAAINALKRELSPLPSVEVRAVAKTASAAPVACGKRRSSTGKQLPCISHCSSRQPSVSRRVSC